jgi:hypothetical protein
MGAAYTMPGNLPSQAELYRRALPVTGVWYTPRP